MKTHCLVLPRSALVEIGSANIYVKIQVNCLVQHQHLNQITPFVLVKKDWEQIHRRHQAKIQLEVSGQQNKRIQVIRLVQQKKSSSSPWDLAGGSSARVSYITKSCQFWSWSYRAQNCGWLKPTWRANVYYWIAEYAEVRKLFPKFHFGFHKWKWTTGAASLLFGVINSKLNRKSKKLLRTYTIFISRKCFDFIDRSILFTKLKKTGIPFKICNIIYFIYKNTKVFIRSGAHLSVQQGCQQ